MGQDHLIHRNLAPPSDEKSGRQSMFLSKRKDLAKCVRSLVSIQALTSYLYIFLLARISWEGLFFFAPGFLAAYGVYNGRMYAWPLAAAAILGLATVGGFENMISWQLLSIIFVLIVVQLKYNKMPAGRLVQPGLIILTQVAAGSVRLVFSTIHTLYFLLLIMQGVLCAGLSLIFYDFLKSVDRLKMGLKTTKIHWISWGIAAAGLVMGLHGFQVSNFQISESVERLIILLSGLVLGSSTGAAAGVLMGIAGSMGQNDMLFYTVAMYSFCGLLGGLLKKMGKIGVIAGFLVGQFLISIYTGRPELLGRELFQTFVAGGVLILIPSQWMQTFKLIRKQYKPGMGTGHNLKKIISQRFKELEDVFRQLSLAFNPLDSNETSTGDLSHVINNSGNSSGRGRENVDRSRVAGTKKGEKWFEAARVVDLQLRGVAGIMNNLASEIILDTGFEEELQEQIRAELNKYNILVKKIEVLKKSDYLEISFINHSCKNGEFICMSKVIPILEKISGKRFSVERSFCGQMTGEKDCIFKLKMGGIYEVEVGAAQSFPENESMSGDAYTFLKLMNQQVLILSDGMGVGEKAARESRSVISLLSRLLKTGFDIQASIEVINSILLLRSRTDTFATIDLAVIDLHTAGGKIIKVGAQPSFVKRGKKVHIIETANIPAGILKELKVEEKEWQFKAGDFLVMVTDGFQSVSSIPLEEWLPSLLKDLNVEEPREMAQFLVEHITLRSGNRCRDDCSVLVARFDLRLV